MIDNVMVNIGAAFMIVGGVALVSVVLGVAIYAVALVWVSASNKLRRRSQPVIRCKDCKWFADNNDGEWYGCQMFQVVRITPEDAPKPDDFCSYGEQKDGGADHEAG